VTLTPTTSWAEITEFGTGYRFKGISVKNYTDGDVEIAILHTTFADIVCKEDTDLIYEFVDEKTPIYVRRVGGTSGSCLVRLWG
jgi:hypothetical protein